MKKLKQVILSCLAVAIIATGLAGCGSHKNDASQSSASKDKVTKVTSNSHNKNVATEKDASSSDSSSSSSSNDSSSSELQLGLGDVAVWTDNNGVTHHVDSDGMDRQTLGNQSGTHYQDWSGSLPSNAQVIHQN
ncbi:MAG: hypothetical protein Q3959_01420 [Limosilactobacillus sp.]|uniref:hypothetical protein n=1 Tax=Limosilactobacillus sp. TaxID=2773925 RepID=UPI0026F75498|nr:hypothetical protein [Limosilactobacillus sp.]